MPWCEPCDRFYNPNTLSAEGECPSCGGVVLTEVREVEPDAVKIPWHFWVAVTAVVGYLGWRVVQGVDALAGLF